MRRPLVFGVLVLAAACGGVLYEQGNAFPCDFSQPPGVRDAPCAAGDVCGVDNRCRAYLYEGPRFEGPATVPDFSRGGEVLHPLVLQEPITFLAREQAPLGAVVARLADDDVAWVGAGGWVSRYDAGAVEAPAAAVPFSLRLPEGPSVRESDALLTLSSGGDLTMLAWESSARGPRLTAQPVSAPGAALTGLRGLPLSAVDPEKPVALAWSDARAGTVRAVMVDTGAGPLGRQVGGVFQPIDLAGAQDAVFLTQPTGAILALQPERLALWMPPPAGADGGSLTTTLASLAPLDAGISPLQRARRLRIDTSGRLVAALRGTELSTWLVSFDRGAFSLSEAWPSCTPCTEGAEALTATTQGGQPAVEVLCRRGADRLAVRVTGSIAVTPEEPCVGEPFALPLDPRRLAPGGLGPAVQSNEQAGALLGGTHGELWGGESLSALRPLFLDRVPRDVSTATLGSADGGVQVSSLLALTDTGLFVKELGTAALGERQRNGFRRIQLSGDFGLRSAEVLPVAFIRGRQGWGLLATGDLARPDLSVGSQGVLTYGPRLVTGNGEPLRSTIGGEAYVLSDGGVPAFFVAADDGLYLVSDPEATATRQQGTATLSPQLTPEPGTTIRSLALERTPLGTDGVSKARGYLVTSRNVFAWQLGGTPPRWSATPLVLAGGEPVEVWFDSPRSAMGRVGYRDGQVFGLPGGSQLAEALPGADDGGVAVQVLDYENLGGWPVAYASTGLFVARWDQGPDGKLLNRFPDGGVNRPMAWREVRLPTGARPWMRPFGGARPGRLAVRVEDPVAADGGVTQRHQLLLFLDDQVLEVGEHVRRR